MDYFNEELVEILEYIKKLQAQKELYNYGNIAPDICKGCQYRSNSACWCILAN